MSLRINWMAFWPLTFLIPMCGVMATTSSPSFTCRANQGKVEATICTTPEVAEADVKLAEVYRATLSRVPDRDIPAFKQNQRDWLGERAKDCTGEGDLAQCLSASYADRLKLLRAVAESPEKGLKNLLWTDGIACSGNQALIRFSNHSDLADTMSNNPPSLGGSLSRAVASPSQCTLADGRVVRFKTASLNDEEANGECGAGETELYSVWIGRDKIISREERAGKCDANPVRAIFLDGRHLTLCSDTKGAFDEKADSSNCRNISERLDKPVHDKLPSNQFTITFAADGMRGFCEGLVHADKVGQGDPDWPRKTVAPSAAATLDGPRFDLNNTGSPQHVIGIGETNHFFDGNFFMIAPRAMSAALIAKVIAKQSDEPDPDAARKLGFQVFAGDQTPYNVPRYVRLTAFRKDRATWLYATWAINSLDLPTEIITKPHGNGSQKLICSYQATPNI